ncbi:MAG: transcription initiation factor IIB [Candidatus Altarchaeaceae archaeon]
MEEKVCPYCKGVLFSYKDLEKNEMQKKALTRYLKTKIKTNGNLENVEYKISDDCIKIKKDRVEIGKIILKCELNFPGMNYSDIEENIIAKVQIGNAKIENNNILVYNENGKFIFENIVNYKEEQKKFVEYIKKFKIAKFNLNTSKIANDLENSNFIMHQEKNVIAALKDNQLVCFLTISPYFVSSGSSINIGYVIKDNENIQICYNSLTKDELSGGIICTNCGAIIDEEIIDTGPEWRAFDRGELDKKSRASGAIREAKVSKGLTTEIDRYDRDIKGGGIDVDKKVQLYRMRRLQIRSRMSDSVGRNLSIALPELDRMCSLLNIGESIKEECAGIYRKAVNLGYVKGRSIESIIGAIIYYVLRTKHIAKTLDEIAGVGGIEKKEIGRAYKYLTKKMKLKSPKLDVSSFISDYASRLGIPGGAEEKAKEIYEKIKKYGISAGRTPNGVAASILYFACEELNISIDKKTLLEMSKINLSTLSNRCEEIKKWLEKGRKEENS